MRGLIRRYYALLVLAAIEGGWSVYFTVTRTIPRGHDGFQYFYLKYYFFNEFISTGEVAQWMPYLSHGSPGAWWYIVQSGIFDLPVFALARALQVTSFIPVFYTLLFLEKLLLIIGTWLLAGVHMRSSVARFIVTASVAMTSIWFAGPWWNFHAFVALPAMLFLVHRTLCEFRWQWVFGLSLLLFLQTFGQLSYYLPMTLFYLAAYGGLMLMRPETRLALRHRFHFSPLGATAVVLVNATFLVELLWLRQASREMAFPASQRDADGRVPLEMFLTHGGSMDLRPWIEFFTGVSPHLDYTVFAGFAIAALTLATALSAPFSRAQKLFGCLALLTVLIGTSSPLAVFIYYFWPLGNLFRHLSLVTPVAKVFCAFLAGTSIDRLANNQSEENGQRFGLPAIAATTFALGGWVVLLGWFGWNEPGRQQFLRALVVSSLPSLDDYAKILTARFFVRGAVFAGLSLVAVLAMLRQTSARSTGAAAWVVAGILVLDVVTYNALEVHARMVTLSPREAVLFKVTDLPFAEVRSETTDDLNSARFRTFSKARASLVGTRYWAESLLWFSDGYATYKFTGLWSTAFGSLLEALRQRPGLAQVGLREDLQLPLNDKLVTSIGGLSEPKVRFLDTAMVCPDPAVAATVLGDPAYQGQFALLTGGSLSEFSDAALIPCGKDGISAAPAPSQGAVASYRNTVFTSNRIEFDVDNPAARPVVMAYSDTWSPHWSARVNDAAVPILRSTLAYKAIVIPPGRSRVVFHYRDRVGRLVIASQVAASLGFLMFAAYSWLRPR